MDSDEKLVEIMNMTGADDYKELKQFITSVFVREKLISTMALTMGLTENEDPLVNISDFLMKIHERAMKVKHAQN